MKKFDVIISGTGPVGMTMAILLAKSNLQVLIIDKREKLYDFPRAVAVDDESMRIWQSCGIDIEKNVLVGKERDTVLKYLSADNKELFSIKQGKEEYGYPKGIAILQNEIENTLLEKLKKYDNVQVMFDHELIDFKQEKNHVFAEVLNLEKIKIFKAKYLIGCDGGRSFVRKKLGFKMKGFTYKRPWLVVDLIENRDKIEAGEIWCDYDRTIMTLPLPKNHRRFEIILHEGESEEEVLKDKNLKDLIATRKDIDIKSIKRKFTYVFNARMATSYSKGRVFLAGDAAHVTPPFAGQGLTSGLRDVANLSWKLVKVINDEIDDSLLKTYEIERRPHQKKMIKLAVNMGKIMIPRSRTYSKISSYLLRTLFSNPKIAAKIQIRGMKIQPIYKNIKCFIEKGNLAGRYFPQPITSNNFKFDEILGEGFTVLTINASEEEFIPDVSLECWKNLGAKFLKLSPKVAKSFDGFVDTSKKHLFVIRPDKFIYKHIIK